MRTATEQLPMVLPQCPQHGAMELRPVLRMTAEQRYCGVWYDCQRCGNSVLFPSVELIDGAA